MTPEPCAAAVDGWMFTCHATIDHDYFGLETKHPWVSKKTWAWLDKEQTLRKHVTQLPVGKTCSITLQDGPRGLSFTGVIRRIIFIGLGIRGVFIEGKVVPRQ